MQFVISFLKFLNRMSLSIDKSDKKDIDYKLQSSESETDYTESEAEYVSSEEIFFMNNYNTRSSKKRKLIIDLPRITRAQPRMNYKIFYSSHSESDSDDDDNEGKDVNQTSKNNNDFSILNQNDHEQKDFSIIHKKDQLGRKIISDKRSRNNIKLKKKKLMKKTKNVVAEKEIIEVSDTDSDVEQISLRVSSAAETDAD